MKDVFTNRVKLYSTIAHVGAHVGHVIYVRI